MNRRHFLGLLCSAPAVPYLEAIDTNKKAEKEPDDKCGVCRSPAVFDNFRDVNLCPACGAIETKRGWEKL
jgi:hypothetical protein